jgi:hypothetical protein
LALGRDGFLGWVFAAFLLLGARFLRRPGPSDARLLVKTFAGVIVGTVLVFVGMIGLWETAEVIVLHHLDENGESFGTRLWVIDLDGYPSTAANAASRRVALLRQHPLVDFERDGKTECRKAVVISMADAHDEATRRRFEALGEEARRLYDEKYGFRVPLASRLIVFLLGGPSNPESVIIRLEECEAASTGPAPLPTALLHESISSRPV